MQKQKKRDIYHDFCQKAQLPFFVQNWYLDAVCQGGTWDFVFVELDGKVVAVQPYFLNNKFGFSYITMPLLAKFMGPFLLPEVNDLNNQHLIYEKLIAQLPKVHSFRQSFYPDVKNWLPFYWENYEQTTRYTYRLNVENLEAIYRNFSKSTKYKIRKAAKELEVTEDGTATQFHKIHKMTFDRQGLKMSYTLSQFLAYDRILEQHNVRKMFFAVDKEKRIHAAIYCIQDNGIAYYHLSGSNPQLRKVKLESCLYGTLFNTQKNNWA